MTLLVFNKLNLPRVVVLLLELLHLEMFFPLETAYWFQDSGILQKWVRLKHLQTISQCVIVCIKIADGNLCLAQNVTLIVYYWVGIKVGLFVLWLFHFSLRRCLNADVLGSLSAITTTHCSVVFVQNRILILLLGIISACWHCNWGIAYTLHVYYSRWHAIIKSTGRLCDWRVVVHGVETLMVVADDSAETSESVKPGQWWGRGGGVCSSMIG